MTEAQIIPYIRQRMKARGLYYITRLATAAGLDKGANSFKQTRNIVRPQSLAELKNVRMGHVIAVATVLNVTPGTLMDEMYAAALKYNQERGLGDGT